MISIYNVNEKTRQLLSNKFNHFKQIYGSNVAEKFYEFLEQLKLENESLYNIIIGLAFLDNYCLLTYKKNNNNLTEKEMQDLDFFDSIEDLESLQLLLDDDPSLIYSFISGPLKFNSLNLKGRANLLLQIDNNYAKKFNDFHFLEKMEMFREKSKKEMIDFCKDKDIDKSVFEILNILDCLFIGNFEAFSKTLFKMIRVFYKWKKVIQITNLSTLSSEETEILNIIDTYSTREILYILVSDSSLIETIISSFLEYETSDMLFKEDIEEFYEKSVSKKIKIKLKEV